jgi:hypothetical protein
MGAVTYPHPDVAELLRERFVAVKLDTTEQAKEAAEIVRPGIILWTPLLLFADAGGRVVRQSRGYLPPADFVIDCHLALALDSLYARRFDESAALLDEAAQRSATPELAAEALYWAGIVAFRKTGDKAMMLPVYQDLVRRFPDSSWAGKAWPYTGWEYGRAKLGVTR